MDILDKLVSEKLWHEFLQYKLNQNNLYKDDKEDLVSFVEHKEYLSTAGRIISDLSLSIPEVSELNKKGSGKKRTVFTFCREENYILKMLAFLLKDYDYLFAENLYSFRRETGVKCALNNIRRSTDFSRVYSYKADIHDYFNSVDPGLMIKKIKEAIPGEKRLICLLEHTLYNPYAFKNGEIIKVRKGIMAGVPFSGFLADLYLSELDRWFFDNNVVYARYSDDIIVLSENPEKIMQYEKLIKNYIREQKLTINEKKEARTVPGDTIEFLGFSFSPSQTDISDITLRKLKNKLKRKARSLYRWRVRKRLNGDEAATVYIRYINAKFYHNPMKNEITWCRWYFPVITTDSSLRIIDQYCTECIRYLYTGRHVKKNYFIRYDHLKALGFRTLVNSYWKYMKSK